VSPSEIVQAMLNPQSRPPAVSVLLPCYNAEATLDEAMESILGQTLSDLEAVAVNDGSEDTSGQRLAEWARRDPRVRPLDRPHAGIIAALNVGLTFCRAPLIARMDADDRAHPERLSRQVGFLGSHPEVAVVGCLVQGFPADEVREGFRVYLEWLNGLETPEEIARQIFVESPLAHPSVVVRKEWLDRAGGYQDHGWPEDYDLWLRLHLMGAQLSKVPEVLLDWREHPVRLTRTDSRYSVENFLRAKAHYLLEGPLREREAVILWGAGPMGRRLSEHLAREGAPLVGFVDNDPAKIGRRRRGLPIVGPEDLLTLWRTCPRPVVLTAVGARGARSLIRRQLADMGLAEGRDWWAVA
jgi:cellulose synthase/poly-beta-1,6-N-acetylglucosamine synthase-like glycosyltransferase